MMTVETACLSRRFGDRLAVRDVDINVREGSVYALLGRNGAGKTTTLKMLLGLLVPSAGIACICGFDVRSQRREAAKRIGVVLEANGFYPHLTGAENLDLSCQLAGLACSEATRVIDVTGIAPYARRRVGAYSLGMRQRLAIARALLGAPRVLIMDEPTNGLDPEGMAQMRIFLRSLPQRVGATVLLSTHLLSEVEKIATHIGIMHEGCLVFEGDLESLQNAQPQDIVFCTDDSIRAARVAMESGVTARSNDGAMIAQFACAADWRSGVAALTRALVEAGLCIYSISPRASNLESLYNRFSQARFGEPDEEAA